MPFQDYSHMQQQQKTNKEIALKVSKTIDTLIKVNFVLYWETRALNPWEFSYCLTLERDSARFRNVGNRKIYVVMF